VAQVPQLVSVAPVVGIVDQAAEMHDVAAGE
jgi:hypothetical protein